MDVSFVDPWDWDVDQVVQAFCRCPDTWIDGRPNTKLPEPRLLEQKLRENDVNGSTLLTDINNEVLKNDLEIKSIGHRSGLLFVINKLRGHSLRYKEHATTIGQMQLSIPSYVGSFSPAQSLPPNNGFETPSPSLHRNTPRNIPLVEPIAAGRDASGGTSETVLQAPRGPRARPGEDLVEDASGRKRRKLALTHDVHSAIRLETREQPDGRDDSLKGNRKQLTEIAQCGKGFLGSHAFNVDQLFFGQIASEHRLDAALNLNPLSGTEADEDNFSFVSRGAVSSGRRHYVLSRMRYFLYRPPTSRSSRGPFQATEVQPYPEEILKGGQPCSVFVYAQNRLGIEVSRENKLALGQSVAYNEVDLGGWEFLHKWTEMKDDRILPTYGESDDDDDASEGLAEEIRAEEAERIKEVKKNAHLPKEDVLNIINEEIEKLVQQWKERKRPLRERRAWSTWKKGMVGRKRALLVHDARQIVERMNGRLAKLTTEIANETWLKEKALRKQCCIMELSVFDREDQLWRVALWQDPRAPPRVENSKQVQRKRPAIQLADNDEEVLSSDSENLEPTLEDFIQADEATLPCLEGDERKRDRGDSLGCTANSDETDWTLERKNGFEDTSAQESTINTGHCGEPSDNSEYVPLVTDESEHDTLIPTSDGPHVADIIDLTMSEPVTGDEQSPKIVRARSTKGVRRVQPRYGARPENASMLEVQSWSWHELEERKDRKRIVSKLFYEMDAQLRTALFKRLTYFANDMRQAFKNLQRPLAGKPVLYQERVEETAATVRLYICWLKCDHGSWNKEPVEEIHKSAPRISQKLWDSDFEDFCTYYESLLLQQYAADPSPLLTPSKVLKVVNDVSSDSPLLSSDMRQPTPISVPSSPLATLGLQTDRHDQRFLMPRSGFPSSDSDDPDIPNNTPGKKRKRPVIQSSAAIDLRAEAHERREQHMKAQMQHTGTGITEDASSIVVNPGKHDDHDYIYIDSHIGSRIKPHQIDGIRFMWREIVTAEQGCLLAHTMGLGKTMQAVALLVTIARAAKSNNPKVSEQVPSKLRYPRYLVLCPPALIENWRDELYMWVPEPKEDSIGSVRVVDSQMHMNERLQEIEAWHDAGGVLVLGYHMFRILILNKTNVKDTAPLTDEQHMKVRKQLLEGPSIIVADEAHMLRNVTSSVSGAASGFSTHSRVALTGSPLANNLQEYYAMIDWISPGYLGNLTEFKWKYQEPIEAGGYEDSTRWQQRKGLKMLQVLKNDIDPKINRADITVLKGNLKPKIEFVIKVPLSQIQEDAYKLYVRRLLNPENDKVSNARLWEWLAILQLLCNHPSCFINKLNERAKARAEDEAKQQAILQTSKAEDIQQGESPGTHELLDARLPDLPADVDVSKMGISDAMIKEQQELFTSLKEALESTVNSYKMELVMEVLRSSQEAGDRVLIFSHSIPTLNYIGGVLKSRDVRYTRLDGHTKMTDRQTVAKALNKGKCDVLLISTRAGGLGFNLPGANRVILTDFNFNPTWEEQAIGRAYRIGQEKPVFVYRFLVGGTVEEAIYNKAVYKTQLAYRVVDKKNPTRAASKTSDFLYEPKQVRQEELGAYKSMDPLVLDKILESPLANHIRSIATTETLHAESEGEKLDAEEQKEVADLIELDKLRRSDPATYNAQMQAKQQARYAKSISRAAPGTTVPLPAATPARAGWNVHETPYVAAPPDWASNSSHWPRGMLMPIPSAPAPIVPLMAGAARNTIPLPEAPRP